MPQRRRSNLGRISRNARIQRQNRLKRTEEEIRRYNEYHRVAALKKRSEETLYQREIRLAAQRFQAQKRRAAQQEKIKRENRLINMKRGKTAYCLRPLTLRYPDDAILLRASAIVPENIYSIADHQLLRNSEIKTEPINFATEETRPSTCLTAIENVATIKTEDDQNNCEIDIKEEVDSDF